MIKKNLPIQFFEKRKEYDDRQTEPGGNNTIPSWVLCGIPLRLRSVSLIENISDIKDKFEEKWLRSSNKLPFIVSTEINDNAIAKSYRRNISALYNLDGDESIIGFQGNRCLISKVTKLETFSNIGNVLSDVEGQAKLISSIDKITQFKPQVEDYDENCKFYKVRLINYNNYDYNKFAASFFENKCMKNGISLERKTCFTKDFDVYRVCIDSAETIKQLEDIECIYSIEKMIPISVSLDALSLASNIFPSKIPDKNQDYPTIGVLDTGIQNIAPLKDWMAKDSLTYYPEIYQEKSHGTFVAGIIEYGDELNNSNYTSLPGVKLFEAIVYPNKDKERIFVDELIDHIRDSIKRHPDIKIWNLSLGSDEEASLSEFSDFGMALDSIQDENNVLIIKSVGNCLNFKNRLPKSRISKSADSVRSLVVGSIAHKQEKFDFACVNEPSPFTRIGPGPGNIIKPDLVFYGGNAGIDENNKITVTGVPSFATNGKIVNNVGTSFSTPWIARMAGELSFLINDRFDSLLIKALLIHSAKYPDNCNMSMADKINQMGFGMPSSMNEILYNSDNEATLILRDTLEKGMFIEMFDFPYPKELIDKNGYYIGQITLTLVNKTIVDDKQAGEYCQSNIDVEFGTYESEKERDITKKTIKNPYGMEGTQNLLLDNLYHANVRGISPNVEFAREYTLVKYGKKFHPVKKYAFDLTDITQSNRERFLKGDRKWFLKIRGLFRDYIEQVAKKDNYQLSQEYCLILTIKDPNGKVQVYNDITQQLEDKNFVHYNVSIRNSERINIGKNQV